MLLCVLLICGVAFAATTRSPSIPAIALTLPRNDDVTEPENPSAEKPTVGFSNAKTKDIGDGSPHISEKLSDLFYQTIGNKFYISRVSKNWEDAAQICKDVEMELASITSRKEQLELFKFLFVNDLVPADDYSGYWLSGHQLENGLYNWTAVNQNIDCWGWLPNEPSHIDDLEHCVELKFEANPVRLGWNNFKCERKNRFICQQPNSNNGSLVDQQNITSQEAIKEPETKCYYFYNLNRSRVPYHFGH